MSWHTYSEDGFSFDMIHGCFLSNEFVDALPVHRLKAKNKVLKEMYVSYNNSGFLRSKMMCPHTSLKSILARSGYI